MNAGEQTAAFNQRPNETKAGNPDYRQCSGQGDMEARSDCVGDVTIGCGIRRRTRENGCAPVGGDEGIAEGEQAAERDHHRQGIHSLPIEVIWFTFILFLWRPNVRKIPRK
jgi:hypothetical protein